MPEHRASQALPTGRGLDVLAFSDPALVERYLIAGESLESELALFSVQEAERRKTFETRLRVIDEYICTKGASVTDVDFAAAKLGVTRRQFYRLLAKLRTFGPVRGLLPNLQNVERASASRDGLAEPVEALLAEQMARDPTVRIAALETMVKARCRELEIAPPSEWKLRKRIQVLRGSGTIRPKPGFGSSIVFDQAALDLAAKTWGYAKYVTVTLALDRSTRLILGAGCSVGDGIGMALQDAIADMPTRMIGIIDRNLNVAPKLNAISWIVPPGLENIASSATGVVDDKGRTIESEVISSGSRRHGELILRLVGDRLGPFQFRTRTALDIDADRSDEGASFDLEDISRLIGYCVESWNNKIVGQLPTLSGRELLTHKRRAERIIREVEFYFDPVMRAVTDRFERDQDWMKWERF